MRNVGICGLALALWYGTAVSAQGAQNDSPSPAGGWKIGFVNTLEVLYGTEEGKQEIAKVEQFIQEKQQIFDTRSAELQKLQEQFANQQRTLNAETRSEMQRQIEEKDRELKRFQEDTQLDINRRRDELLNRMSEKIRVVIEEFAQKNGFGAVFLRDQTQPYVNPELDITQEIIRIYNEKHPVAAPPSSPPSSP